jgi:hypothetical protein
LYSLVRMDNLTTDSNDGKTMYITIWCTCITHLSC